jgi:hypothetical protein
MTTANIAVVPSAPKAARYTEDMIIRVLDKGKTNPKRAASAKRYAIYLQERKTPLTVKEYLDACLVLQPEEPRHRWRADLTWDTQREFIEVVPAPAAEPAKK